MANPIDRAISGLYEMIAGPERMDLPAIETKMKIGQVRTAKHRAFLERMFEDVRGARASKVRLRELRDALEEWLRREFPSVR